LAEGPTIGFSPDTAGSWAFSTTENVDGDGLTNNRQIPAMTVANSNVGTAFASDSNPSNSADFGSEYAFNKGFARRSEWYGYTPSIASRGQQLVMNETSCSDVFRARRLPDTTTGLSATKAGWSVIAKLRLKDLAHYFEKCPLLKGSTMRFLINTNQTTTNFTTTVTAGPPPFITYSAISVSSQGLTNPIQLASGAIGQGCSSLTAGAYSLAVSIYRDSANNVAPVTIPVRLYAPVYKMNPIAEQRYLSLAPTKRIEYNDIFQYQFPSVKAGEQFNFLVSNGIPNIKSVLVVPFLSAVGNDTDYNTLLSPFSTSGATPDPIPLSNFNILLSGVNLFLNNQIYDYEQFNQELKSSNQLNGSLTTGLASGLISEDDFARGMRYYYGNASRCLPSEEGVSRSVQILGKNSSLREVNLMVFVEFGKSMTVDISTGARLD
jgi:hypothetical protein